MWACATKSLACLAEFNYEFDELEAAETHAAKAMESGASNQTGHLSEILLPSRFVLARVRKVRGRRDEAMETLLQTRRDVIELGMTGSLIYCDAELALLALEIGDAEPAESWFKLYRLSGEQEPEPGRLYAYLYLARIYAAQGRTDEAGRLTAKLLDVAERADRLYIRIELAVLQALLLYRAGRPDEALARFRAALFLAEPRGYARTFLDAGEPAAELLTLLVRSGDRLQEGDGPSPGYVRSLLAGFGKDAAAGRSSPDDPMLLLTKKEHEILRLLSRQKTNREIAAELGIGHGTVRMHLNNIYSKLMVSGRSEAIRKGEQFGL